MKRIVFLICSLICMTVLANGAVLQIESYTAFPKGVFKRYPRNSDSLIKAGEYNVCFKGIQKIHGGYLLWGYLKGTKPKIELLFVSPDGEEGEPIILNRRYRIRICPYFDTDCSTNFEYPGVYNIIFGENVLWIPCEGNFRYIYCSESLRAKTVDLTRPQAIIDTDQVVDLANYFIDGVLNNNKFDYKRVDVSAVEQKYQEYVQGDRHVSYRKKHIITNWTFPKNKWSCPADELIEREFFESCKRQHLNTDSIPNLQHSVEDINVIYYTKDVIVVNVKCEIQNKKIEIVFDIKTKDNEYQIIGVCYPHILYATTHTDMIE